MEIWTFAVGLFMPPVVSFFKKSTWPKEAKMALSMLICVVAAVAGLAVQKEIDDVGDVVEKSALIWTTAQATYGFYFEGTKLEENLREVGIH